jgi:hypothetical protein
MLSKTPSLSSSKSIESAIPSASVSIVCARKLGAMVNSAKPTTKDQAQSQTQTHGLVRVFGCLNPRGALGGVGVRCWVDFIDRVGLVV